MVIRMSKPQLWTKDFLINTTVTFLIFLGYYLLMVIIADYAMDYLQASPSEAGLVAGIFIVATLFARIFTGRAIERVGRKKMLYIGLSIFSLATLLYFKADSLQLLFIVRILHGFGFGIATTSTVTIAANIIPKERQGEGISYAMMSVTLASAIGPFIGMNLYQYASFYAILVICVILLVIISIATFLLKVPEPELTQDQIESMKRLTLNNFFEVKALPIALIGTLVFFSYSSIISFLSTYTKEINLTYTGSFFFIVYSVAVLISRPLTGRWFDSKGENFVMYPSFILFAIGLIVLSQAHQGVILLLSAVLLGLGYGTFSSCGQAIAIKLSPAHRMGLATSTFLAIAEMGIGFGPYFLGFLIPTMGFSWMYISMAVVVIISMCLYYFLHGKSVENGERLLI
jgi:MFS family permease